MDPMLQKFHWPVELEHLRRGTRRRGERESRFETLFMNSFRKARERARTLA
jgi:hypothetical protein